VEDVVTHRLTNRIARLLPLLAAAAGVGALLLLARSVENSADFGRSRPWIQWGAVIAVIVLAWLLARKLWQLIRDYRQHVPGSRLTMRTVGIFGALVAVPLCVVYLFSLDFLNRGIDSWFQINVKQGLSDALTLSRSALTLRTREQFQETERLARAIADAPGTRLVELLDQARKTLDVSDIVLYGNSGRPLAVASSAQQLSLPTAPPRDVLLQLSIGGSYMLLEPQAGGRFRIVTAANVPTVVSNLSRRFLVVNYEVPDELAQRATAVQNAYSNYGELTQQRQDLMLVLKWVLSLVLLLTLLAAIYGAIFSAQTLTRPVQDLIAGTRAVGKGDFDTRLTLSSRDEMGFLVHSFNDMTKRLRRASEEAETSKHAIESERARLSIILSRLSSGVIVVDETLHLLDANEAAGNILGWGTGKSQSADLGELAQGNPLLTQFVTELALRFERGRFEWREQLELPGDTVARVLLWACTRLPGESADSGLVLVFEDITTLLEAQRSAAWGEVARRLAHEIRNPLTPIQLSAERLHRKLRAELSSESAQLLDRATSTIVQQVDAMQQMVNAFSDYARAPELRRARFSLNQLVVEVAELYRLQNLQAEIKLALEPRLTEVEADRGRLRQLLANLISNALHAVSNVDTGLVEISTGFAAHGPRQGTDVVLEVSDNGAGFAADVIQKAFEPYVTNKVRGTGLGLAIVKRIVEEHAGHVEAVNRPQGGATVRVRLPIMADRGAESRRERA
jgi:nitrogen fixation/metabolism regulation signal transduction histidine kinase